MAAPVTRGPASIGSTNSSRSMGPSSSMGQSIVSDHVREVASGAAALPGHHPASPAAAADDTLLLLSNTLLEVERLVNTAKSSMGELTTVLQVCDVVTRGMIDRRLGLKRDTSTYESQLQALQELVLRLKEVAVLLCNKGRSSARSILGDIATIKTKVIIFATVNDVAITDVLYVSE